VRPFAREGLAQVAGAVVGGPFDLWRSLREWLNDHSVVGILVFWALVAGLLVVAWWWGRRRVLPQLAVATLPTFAAGLLLFYAWFGVGFYFTRYLAPVALVAALMIAVGIARVWRERGRWRVPAFAATGVLLAVGVVAALRADTHHLTATEASELSFDSVTGYRAAARTAVAIPPPGSVLGAWQSGAFGYYAGDRLTVVNLDGVVDPDAADAAREDRTAFYIRDRGIGWLADFDLHLVWFAFRGSEQLHPKPTFTATKGLPQFPPFPNYGVGRINWPPGSGVPSR
jgi:hypothetical protein